jgi:hypothetical protein
VREKHQTTFLHGVRAYGFDLSGRFGPLFVAPSACIRTGRLLLRAVLTRQRRTVQNTKERFGSTGQPELPVDYFLVVTHVEWWYVSRDMAQTIEASLSESPVPEWVTFVDLTGARVRVRARRIECIYQCTAEQRVLARAFQRARSAERKAEKDWEEDE